MSRILATLSLLGLLVMGAVSFTPRVSAATVTFYDLRSASLSTEQLTDYRIVGEDTPDGDGIMQATYGRIFVKLNADRQVSSRVGILLLAPESFVTQADLESLVTSGGAQLPTPEGTFQILTKQKDFTFHSPWPKGNPFWYPDSPTHFAMMFEDGGYFIHDAPWRHRFGPGSNLIPGQPGEELSGTHGCVNVPLDFQAKLFAWTAPGTPVVIQQ